jgi:hypothetical protein
MCYSSQSHTIASAHNGRRRPTSRRRWTTLSRHYEKVLDSYPQKGQACVDCNGWTIVNDNANQDTGLITLAIAYKSCVGPAALAFNFGQPFIDDLKLEVQTNANTAIRGGGGGGGGYDGSIRSSIVMDVKSSSRMGSSDLFVNRTRLEYLGNRLKERGWSVPSPKYMYEK